MKSLLLLTRLLPAVLAAPAVVNRAAAPTVIISAPQATIIGTTAESGKVESFSGIPFALPPVGQLRLKPPVALTAAQGTITATGTAKACPQMFFSVSANQFPTNVLGELIDTPLFQTVTDAGEDCLTINIRRPAGTTASSKLPVLFWIFGGGFELGSTSMYDGSSLVSDSITMGKPVIFVAVNYRVAGFGFLPGKEILADGSSNLGLLDQRLGLKWTADNIAAFGGDPDKVTIWGESAGAISVFDQMAMYDGDHTYKGKPLFRGGIMNSGSIVPADPVDCAKGQVVYDTVVSVGGCSNASDTLACLRGLDYETYLNAANSVPGLLSYSSIALSYVPRPDGKALTQSPDLLALAGKYAPVPFIIGDQEDEGTLFALFQTNISTTAQVIDYLKTYFFNEATTAQVTELVNSYPDNASDGSPFRTGALNEVYPQFKRLAAILGDATFTLSRRALLNVAKAVKPTIPTWSYLSSYDYGTAFLGTFHGSDLLQVFYGILPNYASASIHNYYFNFVYNLDPNNATGTTAASYPDWPKWSNGTNLMQFYAMSSNLLPDTFRNTSYQVLAKYTDSFRI